MFDVWVDFMDARPSRLGKNLVSVPRVGEKVKLATTDESVSVAYEVLQVTHWLTDTGQEIHLLVGELTVKEENLGFKEAMERFADSLSTVLMRINSILTKRWET